MTRPPRFLWHQIMRLFLGVVAMCLAFSPPAHSGAWPREKGTAFVSVTTNVSATSLAGPYAIYSTIYGEYGLGRDLTLGVDIGHGVSGRSKAILFIRRPVGELAPGHLIAAELGLGEIAGEMVIRPGLSYGHGLSFQNGKSGWLSIETLAELHIKSGRIDFKSDFTFGVTHSDRFKSILQLQTGLSHGDAAFARLAPSVVMKTGKNSHLEIGLTGGVIGDKSYGVKLGFWRDF